jgi:glycosyltransferase involved in cell wall biosynthesis
MNLRTLIVIPAYNEEGTIARVIAKIPLDLGASVLVVDDVRGRHRAEARATGALVTRHERNRGVGGDPDGH